MMTQISFRDPLARLFQDTILPLVLVAVCLFAVFPFFTALEITLPEYFILSKKSPLQVIQ